MKKELSLLTVAGYLDFAPDQFSFAQDGEQTELSAEEQAYADSVAAAEADTAAEEARREESRQAAEQAALDRAEENAAQDLTFHQEVKRLFIDGDPRFMSF